MDGSQKLPQRLLATIAARLDRGEKAEALSLGVAARMRWQDGRTDAGETFTVDDPLAALLGEVAASATTPADKVAALLAVEQVFPARLAQDAGWRETLTAHLARLMEDGARAALAEYA